MYNEDDIISQMIVVVTSTGAKFGLNFMWFRTWIEKLTCRIFASSKGLGIPIYVKNGARLIVVLN